MRATGGSTQQVQRSMWAVVVAAWVAIAGMGLSGCHEDLTRCSERFDVGPCDAAIEMVWFDRRDGVCREFIWGGCAGNVPFETMAECQETCEEE